MTKFPDNARLGLTLYFKSPVLGEIMFVDVDASPDDGGEVELLPQDIAVLTRRWCTALNRMHRVKDFRPATRKEIVAYIHRHNGVDRGRGVAKPARRSTSAAVLRAASAGGMRRKWRELSSRYFGISQLALAALRSTPRARLPAWRRASEQN
jgi:hypothetical protein